MLSYSEYFRQRLYEQSIRLQYLDSEVKNITGKKRKYEEAMGYPNDYLIVQEPESIKINRGKNWIDAYLENISNNKN